MDTHLRNALPIVARALGEQYALEVRIEGDAACTDGRIITLPAVDGPEARTLAYGYLDHEAGHVRFTDFDVYRQAATLPLRTALVNILEDVRIERAMGERFPGCRVNLHRLVRCLVETGEFKAASLDDHPGAVVQRYLLYRLRSMVLSQDALEPLAAQSEKVFIALFPPAVAAQVDEVMGDLLQAQSTADVVELADRILAALQLPRARTQAGAPEQECPPDPPSTQPGQSDATAAQASGSPERDPAKTTPDTTQAAPLERTDLNTAQPAREGEVSHNPAEEAASRALQATRDDLLPDLAEATRQRLDRQIAATPATDRWPALPRVVDPSPPGHDIDHRQALATTARLRARLQGLLQTETLASVRIGRHGRVSTRHLWRLKSGDGRVFRCRAEQPGLDTAVQGLLDGSSSMQGDGASVLATEACYAVMKALAGLPGIRAGAAVFYTPRGTREARLRVLTRLGEPVRRRDYRAIATGFTPLAEALAWAAGELSRRREARRMVLVITDGEPDDESAVNRMRARLEGAGIELFGLGIQHDVSHLFDHTARVETLGALPRALFHLLERSLSVASPRVA